MQLQTFATYFALAALTSSLFAASDVDASAGCTPIYKDIVYNCSAASDLLTIKSFSISPESPVNGQSVTIKAQGTLKEPVTGGNIRVEASRFIFRVERDYDLCENASNAGKKCPFEKGDISFNGSFKVENIPPGKYNFNIFATSNTDEIISRINLKIRVL